MQSLTLVVSIVAFIGAAFAQSRQTPPCLSDCLKNSTNPCDHSSFGELVSCLNTQCLAVAAGSTLMLTPKAEYSCQNSFIPGSEEPFSGPMKLIGDGRCITNSFDFKSFIPSSGPEGSGHMNVLAQQCHLQLFHSPNCAGADKELDLTSFHDNKCAFEGGRSMRLKCPELTNVDLNPYAYLARMCANYTTTTGNNSSATATSSCASANNTVHIPSITAYGTKTSGASIATYGSASKDHVKASESPAMANNQQVMKPSMVALVAVLGAAIMML